MFSFKKKPREIIASGPNAPKEAEVALGSSDRGKEWRKYTADSRKYVAAKKYAQYRATRLSMAIFRRQEKAYESAIVLLTEVLCWDINECANDKLNEAMSCPDAEARFLFPKKIKGFVIAPRIMQEFTRCQTYLGFTDDDLRSVMREAIEQIQLPRWLYTKDEVIDIFFLYRKKDTGLLGIVNAAKKRMQEQYPGIKF